MNWDMKTMTDRKDDIGLDDFFSAARDTPPELSVDFMKTLTEQALAAQPVAQARVPEPGIWGQLKAAIGGWPGLAGLAATCAVGVWLGISPTSGMSSLWDLQQTGLGALGIDPLSGYDLALMEG
jgi:hypothetical protein